MPGPVVAHAEEIHITSTSGATLSDATKLDESSKLDITKTTETVERKNLNSADGWSLTSGVWHSGSGSIDGRVVRDSTVQGTITTAESTGATAYITKITNAAAGAMEVMGYRYPVVFESFQEGHEAGQLVTFTAAFKFNGAPTTLMGT